MVFSFWFSNLFAQFGWLPLGGLALANSLATALEAIALFIFMRKRLNGIEGKSIADSALRVSVSGLGMAIGLLFWIQATGSLTRWVVTLGGVAVGGIIYLFGVLILKVPEIKLLTKAVSNRIKRA